MYVCIYIASYWLKLSECLDLDCSPRQYHIQKICVFYFALFVFLALWSHTHTLSTTCCFLEKCQSNFKPSP